jgi:hypothetical protein
MAKKDEMLDVQYETYEEQQYDAELFLDALRFFVREGEMKSKNKAEEWELWKKFLAESGEVPVVRKEDVER